MEIEGVPVGYIMIHTFLLCGSIERENVTIILPENWIIVKDKGEKLL